MFKILSSILLLMMAVPALGSEPFTIFEGEAEKSPKQPQACVSSDGVAHVAFGVGEQVYYSSVDGEKVVTPRAAFKIPNMSLGMRRGPRIAHDGKAVCITAIGGAQGKGKDGDVLAYRSLDGGTTWLGPVRVNDVESSAREGLHAMTAAEDGTLWCVWLDLRVKGTQLFASKSSDHGATWSKNVLVYRSPDGSICECCHPSIAADGSSLHVLFRNSLGGNRDMYIASSRDHGESFGNAVRLGLQNWKLNACPMDGGMLAVSKLGKVSTVWRRDRNICTAAMGDSAESVIGAGEQPWIASSADGNYIVWTIGREGALQFMKPNESAASTLATKASHPVVVAGSKSTAGAFIFWEETTGKKSFVMGYRVP